MHEAPVKKKPKFITLSIRLQHTDGRSLNTVKFISSYMYLTQYTILPLTLFRSDLTFFGLQICLG